MVDHLVDIKRRARELGEVLGHGVEFPDAVWDPVADEIRSMKQAFMASDPVWDYEDREQWEREVLHVVADEVAEIARSMVINELF